MCCRVEQCVRRSKWKYQTTAILLAFMMVYLLFCAVMCAVKAADGGSVAFRTMVFSVIITYGGKVHATPRERI